MIAPLAILGPGTLGLSTAQWAAECGLETRLLGRDLGHAEAGLREIHRRWDRACAQGRLSAEARDQAAQKLGAAGFGPQALESASSFLEALPEDPDLKASALASLNRPEFADLLVLSGTSALPISDLARRSGLVGRLVGFHLFVPVPRMAVVEMAVAPGTPQALADRARKLGLALRKRVVQVRDQPGFAAARMALAQGLEAMRLLETSVASAEDLDALMTLGYGHPVGPLELSDRVGLGLRLRIAEGLAASGEARFAPPSNLKALAAEGATGLKARRGFYHWDSEGNRA
ncbi:MAG TPA: 3-hydroxyacyl-CoA dehydrogenase family protein [Geothrix sp.]|nr:3-hydroxyacyl-CoA dehydrogenase family protein [Geothrix sp.]